MSDPEVPKKPSNVLLRAILEKDLQIFFEQQLDPEAIFMAAFTVKNPADKEAFLTRWRTFLNDNNIVKRTILWNGQVTGHILSFEQFGEREVTYWLGREFWGNGIATQALALFLDQFKTRPLYARAAKDNLASIRVLEKCGFRIIGEDKGFANGRGEEIQEYVLRLSAKQHQL